jgi:hypothetical protein
VHFATVDSLRGYIGDRTLQMAAEAKRCEHHQSASEAKRNEGEGLATTWRGLSPAIGAQARPNRTHNDQINKIKNESGEIMTDDYALRPASYGPRAKSVRDKPNRDGRDLGRCIAEPSTGEETNKSDTHEKPEHHKTKPAHHCI